MPPSITPPRSPSPSLVPHRTLSALTCPQKEPPLDPYERPSYPFFQVPVDLLIGAHWVAGEREPISVANPATGQLIARVANASVHQALQALDAACAARISWAATTARQRANILHRAYGSLPSAPKPSRGS